MIYQQHPIFPAVDCVLRSNGKSDLHPYDPVGDLGVYLSHCSDEPAELGFNEDIDEDGVRGTDVCSISDEAASASGLTIVDFDDELERDIWLYGHSIL